MDTVLAGLNNVLIFIESWLASVANILGGFGSETHVIY
jgi:hypothetical protein